MSFSLILRILVLSAYTPNSLKTMNPRVLMLGWEFPPLVSGGLGIASQALSKALSELTPVTMLVPKGEEQPESKLNLISLEQINVSYVPEAPFGYVRQAALQLEGLGPYESQSFGTQTIESRRQQQLQARYGKGVQLIPKELQMESPYGHSLFDQLLAYSQRAIAEGLRQEFDLIHAHDWLTFIAGLELKKQTQKPLVVHIHSLEYDRSGPGRPSWVRSLEKYAMEQADLVIPVSVYSARIVVEKYGIPLKKVRPVHNGLDFDAPYQTKTSFPQKLIVFIGRLAQQKAPETFVEMAMKLVQSREDVRFAMAGEGELREELQHKIARLRMGDRFHFMGFIQREEIRELLSMAYALVMPSRSEPFGLVALEAAHFGLPCIISHNSGVAEVLPSAIQINPEQADQVTQRVDALLSRPSYYTSVSQQIQTEAKALTWEKTAAEVLNAYKQIS